MKTTTLDSHPAADAFPLMSDVELNDLADDIRARGLEYPILLDEENRILDGRNRFIACEKADVEPEFDVYRGDDPVGTVISLNLTRRHLSESQRAMVASRLASLKQGQKKSNTPIGVSKRDAAEKLNVGAGSMDRARAVQKSGSAELNRAVDVGDVSLGAASELLILPKQEQTSIVRQGAKAVKDKAAELRKAKDKAFDGFDPQREVKNAPKVRWSKAVENLGKAIDFIPVECLAELSDKDRAFYVDRVWAMNEKLADLCESFEETK